MATMTQVWTGFHRQLVAANPLPKVAAGAGVGAGAGAAEASSAADDQSSADAGADASALGSPAVGAA